MGHYKLNQMAKADLRELYRYGFFAHGEQQADRYYASLFDRFRQIADMPYRYPSVDHIRQNYRRSVCGMHSIYYRITGDNVEIMRLLRAQDTDKAF